MLRRIFAFSPRNIKALIVGLLSAIMTIFSAVCAFAVDTSVADMFALVDVTAISTGQKLLYGLLITCTLITVGWVVVTKILKRAPRAV